MASDKKSDDFAIRIPDEDIEKDPFLARTPSHRVAHTPGLVDKLAKAQNSPGVSILAYCFSSISMTVVNKYCVSGKDWNLNLFYLAVQVWSTNDHRKPTTLPPPPPRRLFPTHTHTWAARRRKMGTTS